MNSPFFSVIIPTYNRAGFISKTIQSVLDQTFDDFEVIVVDDGSSDNTEEVLKQFKDPRIQYFKKKNEERNIARNFGIKVAKGKYIGFLDSDDYYLKFHLQTAYKTINQNLGIAWFYFLSGYYNRYSQLIPFKDDFSDLRHDIVKENNISINGVIIKSEVLKKFQFIPSKYATLGEDHYLWLKLAARYEIFVTRDITSIINYHEARGVFNPNVEDLIIGTFEIIDQLKLDKEVQSFFGKKINKLYGLMITNIALLVIEKNNKKVTAFKYLFMAIKEDFRVLGTKRFLATLKNIFTRK